MNKPDVIYPGTGIKRMNRWTSLIIQCFRLHIPIQKAQLLSLVGELRSHMPYSQKLKTENRNNIITKVNAAAAKSLQSCPTLCDPIDGSPPGSAIPGIL